MIWEELKKIWRPGTVLAVLLLGFVYDTLFLAFYTTDSPFDQEAAGMVQVCSDLVQTYGTDLSEEAFTQFQADIPALHKQADQYVSQSRIGKNMAWKHLRSMRNFANKRWKRRRLGQFRRIRMKGMQMRCFCTTICAVKKRT